MGTVKERMRLLVEKLPDNCTWEEVADRVLLCAKLAKCESDFDAGLGVPHDDVMKEMDAWLESSGARTPVPTSSAI